MGNAGRKPVKVNENDTYSKLIFLIASGNNYNQKISEYSDKDPSLIFGQLKRLKDKKYIIGKREKYLNKKIYSVNWQKINNEFIEHLRKFKKRLLKQNAEANSNIPQIYGEKFKPLDNKIFLERIKNNKYLTKCFETYFIKLFEKETKYKYNIEDIFNYFILFGDDMLIKIESFLHIKEEKCKKELNDFIDLIKTFKPLQMDLPLQITLNECTEKILKDLENEMY